MNILRKIWNGFCWLWVGLFLLGVPGGVLMYFTEPDVTFFESIGVAIFCIPLAWMFYAIGPKRSRDKRILEMKAIAERATKKKAAEEKKAKEEKEEEDRIRALCDDEDQFKSYKKGKICLGMHIEVVQEIKGYKYDEKRNISPDKETFKYKYGKFTTSRGNKRYKLEVTYENDRVVSFKDL